MQSRAKSARPTLRLAVLLLALIPTGATIGAEVVQSGTRDATVPAVDPAQAVVDLEEPVAEPEEPATDPDETPVDPDETPVDPVQPPQEALAPAAEASADPGETREPPAEGVEPTAEVVEMVASDLDLVERQIEASEYLAARTWLEAHLRDLEAGTHSYDPVLIRPLVLLGDARMGEGAFADALAHYQRATHLSRVNAGLKSLDQLEIVYREAAAYKALGAYQDASDREEYAYRILAANTDPSDPALLPGLYRLADWYMATGNPFAARELYQRAIAVHSAAGEFETEASIPALQGLAATYRLERFPQEYAARDRPVDPLASPELQQPVALNNFPAGEQALQQVVRIRQQGAGQEPMALVEAVLDLADWYTLFEKPQRADPLYAHAFELLGAIPDTDRNAYFAKPRLLYLPNPGTPRGNEPGPGTETLPGYIELGFEVSETGYVRNLQTIASQPEGLMDLRVRRAVRVARYRPALVDGVPVLSANQQYRHDFTYEAERPAPDETPEDAAGGQNADAAAVNEQPEVATP